MRVKKILFYIVVFNLILSFSILLPEERKSLKDTALLIIDVQHFYFPGGALPLNDPEKTADNIKKVLTKFRNGKGTVIHIRHNVKKGGDIFSAVAPMENEKVISKDHANSFRDTGLLQYLKESGITNLVITGMQTHMCVEAAVRAAADLGFKCTVISDGCTTRDLKFNGKVIKAVDVHNSTLSTLNSTYAVIKDTNNFITGDEIIPGKIK